MKRIAIVGAGGLGREVAMLIEQINANRLEWHIVGFYDDNIGVGTVLYGYKVLGKVRELNELQRELNIALGIGDPGIKQKVIKRIQNPCITYPILAHPQVLLGKDIRIGEGTIITAANILTVNVSVGKHVLLNLACTLGHDTIIGDFCSLMPGCNISGEVEIGKRVYIGTGVKILNKIKIGENTIIGAGAVVITSLPTNCTAVGVPAKTFKVHGVE